MVTPQATEMQVEGEIGVEEAVKEMLEIEVEEDEGDPFEGMNNTQVAEIYYKMKPDDRCLFMQFKSFHKLHYDLHGHDAPSHYLARGIIREMFSGLPARDADTIANVRAELLMTKRLKDLCKQLGLPVLDQLQTCRVPPEAPEYPLPPPPLCFPSQQDQAKQVAQEQPQQPSAEVDTAETDIKPDMKPPRRLATSYLGQPGLLRMLGEGDEDHIITKVLPGKDPLQQYDEDDPSQLITIDYETDESSDVDNLSVVSKASAGGIGRDEFQGLIADIAAQHQKMAASVDALAVRVEDMTIKQVEEATVRVMSEMGHIRGLEEITGAFNKSEVGLILTTGVRKYQSLKGKREEKDIISYCQLQKKFRSNKRTVMECAQGYKYRYPGGVSTKVPFTLSKPQEETPSTTTTVPEAAATLTPATSTAAETSIPHHNHISPFGTK